MKLTVVAFAAVSSLAVARLHENAPPAQAGQHKQGQHLASGRNWRLTALHGAGAVEVAEQSLARNQQHLAKQQQQKHEITLHKHKSSQDPAEEPHYGSPKCPCVGLDNIPGSTDVTINGTEMNYPADLGAHCGQWSVDRNKACKGENQPPWCSQAWCYVDPCKCDLDVQPKHSLLLPDALFKGKPIYYSYTTCGAKDLYTALENKDSCSMQDSEEKCTARKSDCSWAKGKCVNSDMLMCDGAKPDEVKWGLNSCPCVGVANVPGNIEMKAGKDVQVKGGLVQYPASTGATCESWDKARSPECTEGGENNPPWCESKWCYVDPCNCNIPEGKVPTIAHLLEGAIFQGKPAYYSFATCGNEDLWTAENFKDACKNQATAEACGKLEDSCGWTGKACVGWDITSVCKAFDAQEELKTLKPEDGIPVAEGTDAEKPTTIAPFTPQSGCPGKTSGWQLAAMLLLPLAISALF